jgi:hypothetical protein
VFATSQGDLPITDYLCTTLAAAPRELSPTRFHNSVLNAAAGYWTIATGCRAPSTSLSAGDGTFAGGLFEAACQVAANAAPVLLVSYDIAAPPVLADVIANRAPFAAALVLAQAAGMPASSGPTLALRFGRGAVGAPRLPASLDRHADANPIAAPALALLAALAGAAPPAFALPAGAHAHLALEVHT